MNPSETESKLKVEYIPAESRGYANHGWLETYHSFSFAGYYDLKRMNYGALRVLNDDLIASGRGFGMHPHQNMEIITIVLEGELKHADSMGVSETIVPNEIQIMSAGTGIMHSEYNASEQNDLKLLQIWIYPKTENISPRYDQKKFNHEQWLNNFKTIVSPEKSENTLWINQDAFISLAEIQAGKTIKYQLKQQGNGVYIFVIDGEINCHNYHLKQRDALAVSESDSILTKAEKNAKVLILEVPFFN